MHKGLVMTTSLTVVVALMIVGLLAPTTLPVSAQEVLDRAYAVQTQPVSDGIHHIRTQIYQNYPAVFDLADTAAKESTTIIESYRDLATGKYRLAISDAATGNVAEVSGYDGMYIYDGYPTETSGFVETLYRSTRTAGMELQLENQGNISAGAAQQIFETLRQNEKTEVTQETGDDGRLMYVLRSEAPLKFRSQPDELQTGTQVAYFDAESYRLLKSQMFVQKDDKAILASESLYLVDEILPASASIAWDLSDLGLPIVDDVENEHVSLLPEIISQETLVKRFGNIYLLPTIPEGFDVEITAPPRLNDGEADFYLISYRNAADDYLVIQSNAAPETLVEQAQETYSTNAGLTVYILSQDKVPMIADRVFTSAGIQTPDRKQFMVTSNLPPEQLRALIELLAPVP